MEYLGIINSVAIFTLAFFSGYLVYQTKQYQDDLDTDFNYLSMHIAEVDNRLTQLEPKDIKNDTPVAFNDNNEHVTTGSYDILPVV